MPVNHKKTIYVLIGPKGAGKSFIGGLLETEFNVPFLRVEPIFMKVKGQRDCMDINYAKEGFQAVEREIDEKFVHSDKLSFETTGASIEFDEFIKNLGKKYFIKMLHVYVDPRLCLERVHSRSNENHIQVSDTLVDRINEISIKRKFHFDLIIDNNNKSRVELIRILRKYLTRNRKNGR